MKLVPAFWAAVGGYFLGPKLVPKTLAIEKEQTSVQQQADSVRQEGRDLLAQRRQLEAEAELIANSLEPLQEKVARLENLIVKNEKSLLAIQNQTTVYGEMLSPGGSTFKMYEESLAQAEAMVRLYVIVYMRIHISYPAIGDGSGHGLSFNSDPNTVPTFSMDSEFSLHYRGWQGRTYHSEPIEIDEDAMVEFFVCNPGMDFNSLGPWTHYDTRHVGVLRYSGKTGTYNVLEGWR